MDVWIFWVRHEGEVVIDDHRVWHPQGVDIQCVNSVFADLIVVEHLLYPSWVLCEG